MTTKIYAETFYQWVPESIYSKSTGSTIVAEPQEKYVVYHLDYQQKLIEIIEPIKPSISISEDFSKEDMELAEAGMDEYARSLADEDTK